MGVFRFFFSTLLEAAASKNTGKTKENGSANIIQVTDTRDIRDSALQALAGEKGEVSQKLGFIELALMGKKVSFDKVIKMMDDMVVLLKEEQKDDEAQKEWCETEFETSEDKEVELKHKLEGLMLSLDYR